MIKTCNLTVVRLVENFKELHDRFSKHQKEIEEFNLLWNSNVERFKKKDHQEHKEKFTQKLPYLVMDLEKKYPAPDQFFSESKESQEHFDLLLFEFWSCLDKASLDNTSNNQQSLLEKDSSLAPMIRAEEEALRKEEEELNIKIRQGFELLEPDVKVIFPIE